MRCLTLALSLLDECTLLSGKTAVLNRLQQRVPREARIYTGVRVKQVKQISAPASSQCVGRFSTLVCAGIVLGDLWQFDALHISWVPLTAAPQISRQFSSAVLTGDKNPGSRYGAVGWMRDGTLWLFGGRGYIGTVEGEKM